ncbi:hypothetical protein CO134_02600 [Candidatus Kuenenbacteria bacterium CG_4_9_14_3_um_filter_39_14]|uniref:DegT/DnrJ/EryC1/StrS aminotransferase family protein n=6 Tax=Candidatus Kueneniibacteriota TaxID=1752740 RepID=A0A2M7IM14_9BACT|nr:hypothetical protein [Candidatus Kuenenbacteria bacterium]OIP56305.1 MAG: hypothetical protein AUK13_01350 [Candidatus Kuenenbacteria bacterium CG2_30_39_24]PIP29059.1 MAG: hypothetical protein COX28_01195 [Candidatus Kuenenbacteria bacterium CG23_combo_of_CG06-09_8_20_14_all_39_39]PIP76065.1 MAG: hypothetical protein COW86_00215 [Candidatus Kuenenbacteria bacterium CG22_combo_CG10-13_8_21_14_all_39_9]PIR81046.1 MAG: hypothetical protein COU24_00705 [Candidatus Kuenenbacteria bacterium CG10_
MIREVARPRLRDLFDFHQPSAEFFKDIQLTGSGKGALAIILQYLYRKEIIQNKLAEVIVPDWLGYWVYNQIQSFAFPAKKYSERTKAIMVYHQYGFPQDMDKILDFARDKKLIIIEDCAHAIDSSYKGKPLGTFGDFTIYSFSKWFFCFALGGVKSKFPDFDDYARETIRRTPCGLTLFKDTAKFIYEKSTFSKIKIYQQSANFFLASSYALYGQALKTSCFARRLLKQKIEQEISLRQKRYQYFLQETESLGICQHLEREGVTPYVIPIIPKESRMPYLLKDLISQGIKTGIYHFDLNRNLLAPKFVKSIWIPCHRDISDQQFEGIISTIKKRLST